ncbi:unnamed protein product [Prorocentrum cordatum]|uniref:DNA damage-binding protein 1 n=1 Tax=Prorocentrum cordatum TaxID=2364126 RepID=A0ABN9TRT2_9DINO|nr:unnamed protein product [Polarella glacialis]
MAGEGRTLAAAGSEKKARVYRLREEPGRFELLQTLDDARSAETGRFELLQTLHDARGSLLSAAMAGEGRALAAASVHGEVFVYRLREETGRFELLQTLDDAGGALRSAAIAGEGRALAAAGDDKKVRVHRLREETGRFELLQTLDDARCALWSVTMAGEGRALAAAGSEKKLRVYRLREETGRFELLQTLDDARGFAQVRGDGGGGPGAGLRGGAWLKMATVIPATAANSPRRTDVAVTLESASAGALAENGIRMLRFRTSPLTGRAIAVLLISGKGARIDNVNATCEVELQMLVYFEDSQFGAAIVAPWWTGQVQLTPNPLDVCDAVLADGFDMCLLVPEKARPLRWSKLLGPYHAISLSLERLSSGMKRVARDGEAHDLFEFAVWYDSVYLATGRWREAPPLAEVQDEREIALKGTLTRSALRMPERMPTRLPRERWEALPLAGERLRAQLFSK